MSRRKTRNAQTCDLSEMTPEKKKKGKRGILRKLLIVVVILAALCAAAVFGINFYVKAAAGERIMSEEDFIKEADESAAENMDISASETADASAEQNGAELAEPENTFASETKDGLEEFDCILVLGCGVRDDGSPSPMLKDLSLIHI